MPPTAPPSTARRARLSRGAHRSQVRRVAARVACRRATAALPRAARRAASARAGLPWRALGGRKRRPLCCERCAAQRGRRCAAHLLQPSSWRVSSRIGSTGSGNRRRRHASALSARSRPRSCQAAGQAVHRLPRASSQPRSPPTAGRVCARRHHRRSTVRSRASRRLPAAPPSPQCRAQPTTQQRRALRAVCGVGLATPPRPSCPSRWPRRATPRGSAAEMVR